ncbi:MAG: type IX secretion system membrane protein PorP/SprF [Bacteroidales bacterium]|nr:type IX secretion system membrane protein PorP/SprF [Bacteroidales bacterium]
MKRKIIFFGVLLLIFFNISGQQFPQVSQFMFNHMSINPGSAGNNDMICASAITRQQWIGFPGAPESFYFTVNAPFNLFGSSHGVGLALYRDVYGFNSDIDLKLAYAYRINVKNGKLGIGVSGGFINRNTDGNKWEIPGGSFEDDESIPKGNQNVFGFDLNVGLFYRSENIYLGISSTHLLEPELKYPDESGTSTTAGEAKEKLVRHYYVTASYSVQLANPAFEIIPSVLIKSDAKITDFDLNTTILYNKKFWGGVTYRPANAIIGMVGIEIFNGLKVGYAYDFATTDLTKFSQGSHEIVLNYCFNIGVEKSPQKYKSIRFL